MLLLGVAPLALLEGGLRLAGWPTGRVRTFSKLLNFDERTWNDTVGMFRPDAHSTVMWPPELAYEVHINSLGFRGPEIERSAPRGRTRILVLGDSQTFGFYLEENETWPARLEGRLREAGADVEVVNAGVGGWSIESETRFLLERALALEPDQVVVGFCANDIADLNRDAVVYEEQKRAVGNTRRAVSRLRYATAIYELYLRGQIALKQWREGFLHERDDPLTSDMPPALASKLWEAYAGWLDRLHDALESRGIPLTLVYIPDAYKLRNDIPATDEERLGELARERGIAFVSPLADFEGRPGEELFHLPPDGHLSAGGADLVARAVKQVIAPELAR